MSAEADQSAVEGAAIATEELVLEVRINDQDAQDMLIVLRDGAGQFWLEAADLERLRIIATGGPTLELDGRRYVRLSAVIGAAAQYDEPLAMLHLQIPVQAFRSSRLSAPAQQLDGPLSATPGGFLNYQAHAQKLSNTTSSAGALLDVGLFNQFGLLTSTAALTYQERAFHQQRLDTAFSRDFPERLQTLTVGDSFSDPGAWGSAVRFAGVRFARNFSIRPDLVTSPLLTASGAAVLPSSVDVYINDQRVVSEQVPIGPFVIDNLPTVTGAGDVQVVVRDASGREQTITQAFYSSLSLLAPGLSQYSVSAGRVRKNYGARSFDYGDWAASGTFRLGLTQSLTMEAHGEYLRGQGRSIGLDTSVRLGNAGVASVTTAVGGDAADSGWLGGASFERRGRGVSFGGNVWYSSRGFRRATDPVSPQLRERVRTSMQLGLQLGNWGSMSAVMAHRAYRDDTHLQTVSLVHNLNIGRNGTVNTSVSRTTGAGSSTSGFVVFSRSWGGSRSMSMSAETVRGGNAARDDLRGAVTQGTPVGPGVGWRVGAAKNGSYDAWVQRRFQAADVELQAARFAGSSGQMLQMRGGLVAMGAGVQALRSIGGSFAMVEMAGIADVPVYLEGHQVARTNARGVALLPGLLPYESNRISIDPNDLPLTTSLQQREITIRPASRAGVSVRFPVERISPATFRLLLPSGEPVPAGAEVLLNGGQFMVALDGFTYVTTLDHGVGGSATWEGESCRFRVDPPPVDDPMPHMGDVLCRNPVRSGAAP